jgi:hypothetical protein
MSRDSQLPLFDEKPKSQNVEWFVALLHGRDWVTAGELLAECRLDVTENNKRKLRALSEASEGRVCGHQKGYKLTSNMTHEEYNWWRNEWLKADAAIKSRVLQSDKVFYGRQPVEAV